MFSAAFQSRSRTKPQAGRYGSAWRASSCTRNATPAAILRGVAWRDGHDGNTVQPAIVAHPGEEQSPTGIADAFGQPVVLDQVGDLQVFVGQEIARFHQRTRGLDREVFTLPTDSEIPLCQAFDGLLAVLGALDLARDAPMQALEFRLCLAQIARIVDRVPVRVGVEGSSAPHRCPPVCRWAHALSCRSACTANWT